MAIIQWFIELWEKFCLWDDARNLCCRCANTAGSNPSCDECQDWLDGLVW